MVEKGGYVVLKNDTRKCILEKINRDIKLKNIMIYEKSVNGSLGAFDRLNNCIFISPDVKKLSVEEQKHVLFHEAGHYYLHQKYYNKLSDEEYLAENLALFLLGKVDKLDNSFDFLF